MYGYLKTQINQLTQEEYLRYQQYYCGTCCALHDIFGLKYRIFTSYDASFIGLLISSQTIKTDNSKKNICSVLSKKYFPFDSNEIFSKISACISILIANSKILDSVNEKPTLSLKIKERFFNKSLSEALVLLENNGFPKEYFQQLFTKQEISERSSIVSLLKLTEPTADFMGKLFRYTATVNGVWANENVLYEIGYDVGSIIYITDACIDVLEDLDRKQFNYLLLNSKESNKSHSELIHSEPLRIILEAYQRIKINLDKIEFKKNEALIKNILLLGFPDTIIKRLQKSTVEINKKKNITIKYLPHAAIITGLILLMPTSSYAEWVWNKTVAPPLDWDAYGYACCTGTNPQNPTEDCFGFFGTYIDCFLNPCIYFDTWTHSRNPNFCCGVLSFYQRVEEGINHPHPAKSQSNPDRGCNGRRYQISPPCQTLAKP